MMNANSNPHAANFAETQEGEMNLVAMWTRKDPVRWVSGVLAGILAGAIATLVAGIIAAAAGAEFWYPIKLMATPFLGAGATELGMHLGAILVGMICIEVIAAFWGFVYGHFVYTNSLQSLLAMGLVWGTYLWIFNWCLYAQSVKAIYWANIPKSTVFFICMIYGLSLCSVAFFDRTLRGNR